MASITNADELWAEAVRLGLPDRHLALMNQNWSPEPSWQALEQYAKLALQLRGQPEIILPLIENANWRFNLFGTAFAVLAEERSLLPAIIRKVGDSWASPQLAAGVMILSAYEDEEARKVLLEPLRGLVMSGAVDGELKFEMSSYAVLRLRYREAANEFERRPDFADFWRAGGNWYDMTKAHYQRWMTVLPYLLQYAEHV